MNLTLPLNAGNDRVLGTFPITVERIGLGADTHSVNTAGQGQSSPHRDPSLNETQRASDRPLAKHRTCCSGYSLVLSPLGHHLSENKPRYSPFALT